jgi:hypothetical protein
MIVTSLSLRDTRFATALTYIELSTLALASLEAMLALFPKAKAVVRRTAAMIALRRSIMLIAGFIKKRGERTEFKSITTRRKGFPIGDAQEAKSKFKPGLSASALRKKLQTPTRFFHTTCTVMPNDQSNPSKCAPKQQGAGASFFRAVAVSQPTVSSPTVSSPTVSSPTAAVTKHERDTLLQSINGEQVRSLLSSPAPATRPQLTDHRSICSPIKPWREVVDGEIIDEHGEVVDHDYGKDSALNLTGDAAFKALLTQAAVAGRERAELRETVISLTKQVAAVTAKLDHLVGSTVI